MKKENDIRVVTGSFGYLGRYITKRLLDDNIKVRTITNSTSRNNPFGNAVEAFPFNFDKPDDLAKSLEGAKVLYITYWVRFNHKHFTHETAVQNTFRLIDAAKKAGVQKVVYTSITNPSVDSPLEYFSGKGRIENKIVESGLSYAIVRPAVLFGGEDILINNIAWGLRTFPVIGVFGDGAYKLQPIHVDDLAKLLIECGDIDDNIIVNGIGPETFTYRELIQTIGAIIGVSRPIVSMPPMAGYYALKLSGYLLSDIIITKEEVKGLMSGLLYVDSPPTAKTRLTEWATKHKDELGVKYANELARRKNLEKSYGDL